MDGWVGGWVGRWVDKNGRVGRWVCGWVDQNGGWVDGRMFIAIKTNYIRVAINHFISGVYNY